MHTVGVTGSEGGQLQASVAGVDAAGACKVIIIDTLTPFFPWNTVHSVRGQHKSSNTLWRVICQLAYLALKKPVSS